MTDPGRHRGEGRVRRPSVVTPTPRRVAVLAVSAAVLTIASVVELGMSVAPDATAAQSQVSTVTRAERTDAGPLVLPTIGVVAPAIESLYPTPSAAPHRTTTVSRGTRTARSTPEAVTRALVAITTPPQQTVTPAPQSVTTPPADAPPPTVAAATTTSSATPTGEPAVTPTAQPTATVDVTAGVTGP